MADCALDQLGEITRDRAEEFVAGVDDLARGIGIAAGGRGRSRGGCGRWRALCGGEIGAECENQNAQSGKAADRAHGKLLGKTHPV